MSALGVGMNALYRLTHLDGDRSSVVAEFRQEIQSLDKAVIAAYDWGDLDLEHGFHNVPYLPENDRVRFTISEAARVEVLRRLSELNRQRYEKEGAQGLHADATPRAATTRSPRAGRIASVTATTQPSLDFGTGGMTTATYATPSTAILGFLSKHDGWHAKADVLAATGITDGQWNAAISDLITGGQVERQGERRGARYRFLVGGKE